MYTENQITELAEEWGWKTTKCLNDFEDSILVSTHRHEDYFGQFDKQEDGRFSFRFKSL